MPGMCGDCGGSMKRLFDLTISLALLILLSPLILVVGGLIVLEARGGVFHRSPRIGLYGKPFWLYGFRTMRMKSEHLPVQQRLTRVGRFVRNYSLDHLPQLLNVVRGDMSIVGPRPTEPERVDLNDQMWQKILAVKPGMFSWSILRLAAAFNKSSQTLRNEKELEYVQKASFVYDLHVIVCGLQALIVSRGNIKARGKYDTQSSR
jgi:sugar transferase EpsL